MDFTELERVVIRHAVEDHTAGWYGRVGAFVFGREDAIRYTCEGSLGALVDAHSLAAVWRAVEAIVEAEPQLLERSTPAQQQARREARAERARQLDKQAREAFTAGAYERALELVDQAELADPSYRPGYRTWEEIRAAIHRATAAAR